MDLTALGSAASKSDPLARSVVKGRVLQADADFFCYECSNCDQPLGYAQRALADQLEYKRLLAGAEIINVHITLGLKGGREQVATVKPYQEKRDDARKAELKDRVHQLRTFLANYKTEIVKPVSNLYQEADDSLTQFQTARIKTHGLDSTVIMSGDKDLWMAMGKHCDPKTGKEWTVRGYGECSFKEVGNAKPKLVGQGTSWFWHQMLMGDSADTIPGLPMLTGRLANMYLPNRVFNAKRKDLKLGPAKACAVLEGVTNDNVAAQRVFECYHDFYGTQATSRVFEQGFLLWMRRTADVLDVCKFFAESGLTIRPDSSQISKLKRYGELVKIQRAQQES